MKHLLPILSCMLACLVPAASQIKPNPAAYQKLFAEADTALHSEILDLWFPRSVDNVHGGFHSHFARDWKPLPSDGKFSVFQGRMTWVAAQVVLREPAMKEQFVPIVHHGVDFLTGVMWDKDKGGFYWGLDDSGNITPSFGETNISMASVSASTASRQPGKLPPIPKPSTSPRKASSGSTSMPTTKITAATTSGWRATAHPSILIPPAAPSPPTPSGP